MKSTTIKKKLLLLLTLAMGGSMLLAGISLSILIKDNYEETTNHSFNNYFDRAKNTFIQIHADSRFNAESLANQDPVKNALNLITEYSDIENYQAIIFDNEKKEVARFLLNYAKSAQLSEIRIYDNSGWLIAFTQTKPVTTGIVSFSNGKPVIYISQDSEAEKWNQEHRHENIPDIKNNLNSSDTKSFYAHRNDTLGVEAVSSISRTLPDGTEKNIGQLFVINPINETILNHLSKGSQGKHGIILPDGKIIGDNITAIPPEQSSTIESLFAKKEINTYNWLDNKDNYIKSFFIPVNNNKKLFIVSSLDRQVVNQQINETVSVVFIVFTISALVLLPIGLIFARFSITNPIDKLVKSAKHIEEGKYNKFTIDKTTSLEIHTLAEALNSAAIKVLAREEELRSAQEQLEKRVEERTKDLSSINDQLQQEIIDRLHAETKLNESTRMLQLIMDSIPQNIFWKNINSIYLGCNKNFLKSCGLNDVKDLIGKTDYDLPWTKEESEFYRATDRRIMDENIAEYNFHETQLTAKGDKLEVETTKVPLHDDKDNVIGILGSYQDITDRKNFEHQLVETKVAAEKANKAKSQFLSRMSHELRTPMNAILGFAQLMEMDFSGKDKIENKNNIGNIKEILTAGHHLLDLINEVLDLARIEAGGLNMSIEDIDIADVINNSLALTQSLAEKHDIKILNQTNNYEKQTVFADFTRFQQVVINLITNAIKYNKKGGQVSIDCTSSNNFIRFSFIDTGIGISKKNLTRLFNPFERLDVSNTGIDGTGIGLVICKQLVENMGGNIGVESKKNQGSTFWFTLPCSSSTSASSTEPATTSNYNLDSKSKTDVVQKKILYIEDNQANLQLMKKIVEMRSDITLIYADNADEGINMARLDKPDLILMDIEMPGKNGDVAFIELQQYNETKMIPVIAVSANAMNSNIKYSLSLGFKSYITKPIEIQSLFECLDKYL